MNTQGQNISDGIFNTNLKVPYNAIQAALESEKEVAYFNTNVVFTNFNAASTRTYNLLGGITQQTGTAVTGYRYGSQIRPKLLEVCARVALTTAAASCRFRFVIVRAIEPGDTSAPPIWGQIFTANNAVSTYNAMTVGDKNRIQILYDSGLLMLTGSTYGNGTAAWVRNLMITLPDFVTTYKQNNGTAESVATNNIWIMIRNDENPATAGAQLDATVYYGV